MQSLITDLIEEEISMKILGPTIFKLALYVGKKPTYKKPMSRIEYKNHGESN
jgi:hypothetical protein